MALGDGGGVALGVGVIRQSNIPSKSKTSQGDVVVVVVVGQAAGESATKEIPSQKSGQTEKLFKVPNCSQAPPKELDKHHIFSVAPVLKYIK